MLDEWKDQVSSGVMESLETSSKAIGQKFTGDMGELLLNYDAAQTRKFNAMEADIRAVQEANTKQEATNSDMWKSIELLKTGLAIAEQPTATPAVVMENNFDRSIDLTLLRLSTADIVSHSAMATAVDIWMEAAGYSNDKPEKQYELTGAALDKRFTLKFLGKAGLASQRAKQANQSLRQADGSWVEHFVTRPCVTDPPSKIYISIDKSAKTIRQESLAKKLCQACKESYPGRKFDYLRRDAAISIDWKPCARVVASSSSQTQIEWIASTVEAYQLDRAKITARFHELTRSVAGAAWSL